MTSSVGYYQNPLGTLIQRAGLTLFESARPGLRKKKREAFKSLCGERKTHERIQYTLKKGKDIEELAMNVVLLSLVGAVIGAVVGALVTKWLTPNFSSLQRQMADAQERIAALEQERSEWETIERFCPPAVISGEPPNDQFLLLKAATNFRIERIDYLAEGDAMVSSQKCELEGTEVTIPIEHARLVQIHNLRPRPTSGAIPMKLRLKLSVNGKQKIHTVDALIRPEFKMVNGTHTYCQRIVGGL